MPSSAVRATPTHSVTTAAARATAPRDFVIAFLLRFPSHPDGAKGQLQGWCGRLSLSPGARRCQRPFIRSIDRTRGDTPSEVSVQSDLTEDADVVVDRRPDREHQRDPEEEHAAG